MPHLASKCKKATKKALQMITDKIQNCQILCALPVDGSNQEERPQDDELDLKCYTMVNHYKTVLNYLILVSKTFTLKPA